MAQSTATSQAQREQQQREEQERQTREEERRQTIGSTAASGPQEGDRGQQHDASQGGENADLERNKKERDEAIKRIQESDENRDALVERARAGESAAERQERANRDMKTIRDMAEQATGHLPKAGEGTLALLGGAAVRQGDEAMLKMNFPTPVTLTTPDYRMVRFNAGVQEVPQSLVEDPYLKANGVTRV